MTQSQAGVPYPMIRAFVESRNTPIGDIRDWIPQNPTQEEFLTNYYHPGREESMQIEEIEGIASDNADDINIFLKEKGFSIKLQPFGDNEYGMAAVLDYPWAWLDEDGESDVIVTESGQIYPSGQIERGVSFFTTPAGQVLVRCETQSDDVIWMAMEDQPATDYALVAQVQALQAVAEPATLTDNEDPAGGGCLGPVLRAVKFPCVDLDLETNVEWLVDMRAINPEGRSVRVAQAAQQTQLKMNEAGGRCKSAAAVSMVLECLVMPPPTYKIDRPFLLWCERPGLSQPLFALHVCPDAWKAPADLD